MRVSGATNTNRVVEASHRSVVPALTTPAEYRGFNERVRFLDDNDNIADIQQALGLENRKAY